jgi:DNA-binding XRE family transcriptional regulator
MSTTKPTRKAKSFDELRKPIQGDPIRSARVDEHKAAMLGELRRKLDLTQAVVADRLDVTQENVSQIERGEADVRLSTLSRYVEALGGHLEVRAVFPGETVALNLSRNKATVQRRRRRTQNVVGGTQVP